MKAVSSLNNVVQQELNCAIIKPKEELLPLLDLSNKQEQKLVLNCFPSSDLEVEIFYTADEFEIMKTDIEICKQLGCDGVVTGILNIDGSVDKERMKVLVTLAYPMSVTFHRAFDRTNDAFKALEDIIEIGCERILTSGQKPTAMEGIDLIVELVKKADNRIIIMPGSGIKSDNIIEIAQKTKTQEFHSSARSFIASKMEYHQESMNENLKQVQLNEKEVLHLLSNLASIES